MLQNKNPGMIILERVFGKGSNDLPKATFGRVLKEGKEKKIKQPTKKSVVDEFDDYTDFILTIILIAVMKVNPDIGPEAAIKKSFEWARKMGTPNNAHLWRKQAIRINRVGVSAEVSKLRRELRKML
jgi:hypothetical protein